MSSARVTEPDALLEVLADGGSGHHFLGRIFTSRLS
jgi:hypothetical protein